MSNPEQTHLLSNEELAIALWLIHRQLSSVPNSEWFNYVVLIATLEE